MCQAKLVYLLSTLEYIYKFKRHTLSIHYVLSVVLGGD